MAAERRYFSKEQLENSPSRKCGIDADKEWSCRQQAANFIEVMGQKLDVSRLCIEAAIVYMQRFYVFHSFSKFYRFAISTCSLFLAAKVEYQPLRLQDVIKCAHDLLRKNVPFDIKSKLYIAQYRELIANENVMVRTLGFDLTVDHLHAHIAKCCQLVRASPYIAKASYRMATSSLHLTTMSLRYPPTVVACVCVHLASKQSNWEIPISTDGKEWYWFFDQRVTKQLLEELTSEFLAVLEKWSSRLERKPSGGKETESCDKQSKLEGSLPSTSSSIRSHEKETESCDKHAKLEDPLPSTSSSIRSHEKEFQPCEKRMKSEVTVSIQLQFLKSCFAVPNIEKAHTHQEDKQQVAEHVQTNTANGEPPSLIELNKTKHQKHRIVPAVIPTLPQDDLPGQDWNARRILVESKSTDNLSNKTDAIPVTHKSESDHTKRIDASFDKVGELHSRQERRKKHKHSPHSSAKTSVNTDQVSSAVLASLAGLKLTIYKKNLCAYSTQKTNRSNSERDALKTKIGGPKIAKNDSSNSIKLLLKRDKKRNTWAIISDLQPSKIRV